MTLTEPQTWVLIGIFGAAIFSTIGLQTASFNRNLTTALNSIRESMESKFEATNAKIDSLDRDVQALARRVFGE
jgi:hypothetical protein